MSNDTGTQFGEETCASFAVERGKKIQWHGIALPHDEETQWRTWTKTKAITSIIECCYECRNERKANKKILPKSRKDFWNKVEW